MREWLDGVTRKLARIESQERAKRFVRLAGAFSVAALIGHKLGWFVVAPFAVAAVLVAAASIYAAQRYG